MDAHLLKWDWSDLEAALEKWGLKWKKIHGIGGFHGFVIKDDEDFRREKRQRAVHSEPEPTRAESVAFDSNDDSALPGADPEAAPPVARHVADPRTAPLVARHVVGPCARTSTYTALLLPLSSMSEGDDDNIVRDPQQTMTHKPVNLAMVRLFT